MAAIAIAAAVLSGCATCKPGVAGPPQVYNIQITLDAPLQSDSVRVDVVGVTPANQARWENYSMSKYWLQGDEMREDAKSMSVWLNFGRNNEATQTIGVTNEIWKTWMAKGVTEVAVLADLPGASEDKPEPLDPRRRMFSVCQCAWPDKTDSIAVQIKRSGVELTTVPRAAR